jgi:hypothetical protein
MRNAAGPIPDCVKAPYMSKAVRFLTRIERSKVRSEEMFLCEIFMLQGAHDIGYAYNTSSINLLIRMRAVQQDFEKLVAWSTAAKRLLRIQADMLQQVLRALLSSVRDEGVALCEGITHL